MRTLRSGLVVVVALVGSLAPTGAAVAAPALECGDTITGHVVLTQDLDCSGVLVGLVVEGDVDLDLGGHVLSGPSHTEGGWSTTGVGPDQSSDASGDFTVRNGTLTGWSFAIATGEKPEATTTVREVHAEGVWGGAFGRFGTLVVENSTFLVTGYGLSTYLGTLVVTGTRVADATYDGIHVVGDPSRLDVRDSVVTRNGTGISCESCALTVHGVTVLDNTIGMMASTNSPHVTGSSFSDNEFALITTGGSVGGPSDGEIADNEFTHNVVAARLGSTIALRRNRFVTNGYGITSRHPGTGVVLTLERNTLRRNTDGIDVTNPAVLSRNVAIGNYRIGIRAPLATDLGGNVAAGNGPRAAVHQGRLPPELTTTSSRRPPPVTATDQPGALLLRRVSPPLARHSAFSWPNFCSERAEERRPIGRHDQGRITVALDWPSGQRQSASGLAHQGGAHDHTYWRHRLRCTVRRPRRVHLRRCIGRRRTGDSRVWGRPGGGHHAYVRPHVRRVRPDAPRRRDPRPGRTRARGERHRNRTRARARRHADGPERHRERLGDPGRRGAQATALAATPT